MKCHGKGEGVSVGSENHVAGRVRLAAAGLAAAGGNCVQVAGQDRRVLVRDTKQTGTGPVLRFSAQAWRTFADQVKRS